MWCRLPDVKHRTKMSRNRFCHYRRPTHIGWYRRWRVNKWKELFPLAFSTKFDPQAISSSMPPHNRFIQPEKANAIKSNRQKWRGFWKASESSLRCSSIHTYYSCRSIYREMSYGKRLAALPLINYMNRCMKNGLWGTTSNIHTMFARSLQFASHFSDDPKIYMYI